MLSARMSTFLRVMWILETLVARADGEGGMHVESIVLLSSLINLTGLSGAFLAINSQDDDEVDWQGVMWINSAFALVTLLW